MRIVHLSDLHLGFRQYQRQTPLGMNQREADVALSFRRAIDRTIELAPDLVLIGGDVFHSVRPSNPAILHAFAAFSRLTRSLPNATIVMVAGNHDTPRTAETGCILKLFTQLGSQLRVVEGAPTRISLRDGEVSVLAVPDLQGGLPALTPDPSARHNVLVLHGEVAGVLPDFMRNTDRAALAISPDELGADRWDYVALGHYHVYRQVGANAYYSGSVDYTSADPWGELREERAARIAGKGLIEHDLETGEHRFHHLPEARQLVSLPAVDAAGMEASAVDVAIQEAVARHPGGIDDRIVRLVIRNLPRHMARELDYKAIRELKRRALHFNLDGRRPDATLRSASGAPARRPSLADTVREKLESRPLPPSVDRTTMVRLGLDYLREADRGAAATPALAAPTS